jgi:voltage-gated potassium channel
MGAIADGFVIQIRQIIRSDHPNVRAVEALAFSVPLYLVVFAAAYFLMAHAGPSAFGGTMTRTESLYFSTTVFTTVGFGDITAKNQAARVLVTLQMWLDLVILGLVARVIVNAVKLGKQRHGQLEAGDSGSAS